MGNICGSPSRDKDPYVGNTLENKMAEDKRKMKGVSNRFSSPSNFIIYNIIEKESRPEVNQRTLGHHGF